MQSNRWERSNLQPQPTKGGSEATTSPSGELCRRAVFMANGRERSDLRPQPTKGGSEATSGPSGELCSCTGHPFRVEDAQTGGNEQPSNDPKAHHDCHLCPVEQLEVMMNRRHLE